jgi:hypothetical protein
MSGTTLLHGALLETDLISAYIMRSARAAMTVAGNACAKKDAKSDII